jgi:hypothetical protein
LLEDWGQFDDSKVSKYDGLEEDKWKKMN